MTTISRFLRRLVVFGALAAASLAPVRGEAFSLEEQRLCTSDVFRLCGSELASFARIAACMRQHRADLSQACRAVFELNR
ncbi:hypothetical protein [Rhodopseudomonas sp. B29]|uniref:hypothetical protein n=1 Tax=Rhodopseudomonas sp. B29 TaxID=95607 RepID=UPI00034C9812|nr:hypothetical protein [Rhodopseudomonas sp. B29]